MVALPDEIAIRGAHFVIQYCAASVGRHTSRTRCRIVDRPGHSLPVPVAPPCRFLSGVRRVGVADVLETNQPPHIRPGVSNENNTTND